MRSGRVGVVGHVEWGDFVVIDHLPAPGEIVHATEHWQEAAGGGGVAAVQIAKLGGRAGFFTALAEDHMGRASARQFAEEGVEVHAAPRPAPQRRVFVHLDASAERTITVLGERMVPRGDDPLPWSQLDDYDAIYFTGGDEDALRAARRARVLVATPRAFQTIRNAGVELDVLVHSAHDPGEAMDPEILDPRPRHVVSTLGAQGGRWLGGEGEEGTWKAAPLPGPPVDAFGCGDSFAAGLTYGLGVGQQLEEALELAARCGAACLTGRGPYGAQLKLVG